MTQPILIGLTLCLLVVGITTIPLWRESGMATRRKWWMLLCAGAAFIALTGALYLKTSNYEWDDAKRATANGAVSPEVLAMVDGLEKKLQSNTDDVRGWLLLGRSRMALAQYAKAQVAYATADDKAHHQNADALVGVGVAMLMQLNDSEHFPQAATDAFEQALKINPTQADGLYYGGVSDRENGRLDRARTRWLSLLKQHPSDEVAQALVENIHSVDLALGRASDAELTALTAKATPQAGMDPASVLVRESAGPSVITVEVTIDPALKNRVKAGSSLFISAKPDDAPGPPWLARKVSVSEWPLTIQLSAQDALMGNHDLAQQKSMVVTARVSQTGDAKTQSNDLKGSIVYAMGSNATKPVPLTINQWVP